MDTQEIRFRAEWRVGELAAAQKDTEGVNRGVRMRGKDRMGGSVVDHRTTSFAAKVDCPCTTGRASSNRRRPSVDFAFRPKTLEWFVRSATHPSSFVNAPQLAARPAEEMDAGRPG